MIVSTKACAAPDCRIVFTSSDPARSRIWSNHGSLPVPGTRSRTAGAGAPTNQRRKSRCSNRYLPVSSVKASKNPPPPPVVSATSIPDTGTPSGS